MFRWYGSTRFPVFFDGEGGGGGSDSAAAAEALRKANLDRDTAQGKLTALQKQFDEMKGKLPSEEQIARWAELEKTAESAEEARKRKEGEFDAWKLAIEKKHAEALAAVVKERDAAKSETVTVRKSWDDESVGRMFAEASDLFGPTGKTVLLPAIAQAAFGKHVVIERDETTGERRILVKDAAGTTVVDAKTGKPAAFASAMADVINSHPDKVHILRGSGKVGSGSTGGKDGGEEKPLDATKLTQEQLRDPKVIAELRKQAGPTAIVMGEAYQP